MSIFSWGVQQLVSARPDPTPTHYNPRPPGVIRNGSVTHAVLLFLDSNRGKWYSAYQVVHAVGCTQKSADWAFIFLREQGLIESCPDQRNPRYLRYGANEKTASAQIAEPRVQARKKSVARDEAPLPGDGIQGLAKVRGRGDSDRTPMGGELRAVPGRHWLAADSGALAGQAGHGGSLRTGQRGLDLANTTNEPQAVLPQGSGERAVHDSCSGTEDAGQPNPKQHSGSMARRLQPGAAHFAESEAASAPHHMAGARQVVRSMGSTARSDVPHSLSTTQKGHAT